jgi:circadian clock protein KaiC
MTSEVPELFHLETLSNLGVSNLSDNVVLLQYARVATELRRTVTVVKTRGSAHDGRIREFTIMPGGIVLGGVLGTHPPPVSTA